MPPTARKWHVMDNDTYRAMGGTFQSLGHALEYVESRQLFVVLIEDGIVWVSDWED